MTVVDEGRAGTSTATAEGVGGSPRGAGLLRRVLKNEVARFAAGGLLAALLVGAGTFVVVSRDAEAQAIQHAKDITQVEATGIVEPALSDSLLGRDPAAIGALDTIVRQRILDNDVVRVKLWTADGTVIYCDARQLIGRHFDLGTAELAALRRGAVDAGVSNLTDAENQYERSFGKLLQVYLTVHTPNGTPLLFETYQRYEAISQYQQSVWSSFLPVLIAGLGILFLVQIPLAVGMARRLRASLAERQVLLERVINASEQERRRIARDLHDGVVQRLAAVTFSLSALARRLTSGGGSRAPAASAPDVEHAAGETRAAMRDLRTLIVEIAPPNLHAEGIDNALRDLLEPLAAGGVAVSLDAPHDTALSAATTSLLFRVAQEALRNAGKHAGAAHVDVRLHNRGDHVSLEIDDDGRGFSTADLESRRRDGHVGLSLLRDLVADAGGSLRVVSEPQAGTRIAVEVPC
ncbi:MAG: sensor histidine kinase [Candidatus Dormibacteraeota bacterium]|nr:sensor histidine kinase [Candidatus Dormibacteraeota bacterium]